MKRFRPFLAVACLQVLTVPVPVGGGESQTPNRLADESSPYLQLHAHNPVDWYPWGAEAFERARRENKPIFLSVGYSTCYWCHVMERQVFSDPEIAELMNQWFINIKVDREERPDIDEIYMTTTQLLTGRGGWPNSVFLTPDLEPFYAGTYFPPADQGERPGFPTVLRALHRAWIEKRAEIDTQAKRFAVALEEVLSMPQAPRASSVPTVAASRAVSALKAEFDQDWGGFGGAPKFPSPGNLLLLWHRGENGDDTAREMVMQTLEMMGRGAIYDQLGGGFHRYTLDRAWRIPHFEKMLYDNALLAELLTVAAAATSDPDLERLARGTLDFLLAGMRLPGGGFKSAIDAETSGVEGAFYIWERSELVQVLSDSDFQLLAPILGFDGSPNFEERYHTLYFTDSLGNHAERLEVPRNELLSRIRTPLAELEVVRSRRPFPLVDDKVLTDWNGMAIAAFAQAGRLLSEKRYTEVATRAADFVLGLRDDAGILLHVWRGGEAKQRAFLDDYAYLIRGLLALHSNTGEQRWLQEAERLTTEMERQLGEPSGGYYNSPEDPTLLVRSSAATDGAIPSGSGIAMINLLQLADMTDRPVYRTRARSAIRAYAEALTSSPAAMPTVALAVLMAPKGETIPAGELVTVDLQASGAGADPAWQPFVLQMTIREGWHVNANPASLELLIPTQVTGALRQVTYPQGRALELGFAGDELQVYDGQMAIEGEISVVDPRIELTYQACDERRCLPPVTKVLTLP